MIDLYAYLLREAGSVPESPLGDKPASLRARRQESRRLSKLAASDSSFSVFCARGHAAYLFASVPGEARRMLLC
jgi:hypothetical protein